MTTAPSYLIRVFLVAAACVAALAAWTPAALGQVVEAPADISIAGDPPPPPPPDPAPEPPPPPPPLPEPAPDPGPAQELPPNNPPVDEQPVQDPPVPAQEETRPAVHADSGSTRSEPARESAATPATTTAAAPSDVLATPAQLPPGSAGDDFAFTEQGDAFVLGSGGSGGGDTAVLGSFTRFASIATAAGRIPALGGGDHTVRQSTQAGGSGARLVLVDSSGNTMLFFNLFGGGGGGGAALVFLTALGLLTVFRMMPPDWTSAFRNSTAVWRPSAYVPPIEHPG